MNEQFACLNCGAPLWGSPMHPTETEGRFRCDECPEGQNPAASVSVGRHTGERLGNSPAQGLNCKG